MPLVRKNPAAKFEEPAAGAAVAEADRPDAGAAPAPTPAAPPAEPKTVTATGTGGPAGGHPNYKPAETPPASTGSALVRQSGGALATSRAKIDPALADLKNLLTVDWDTFPRLKAGPGCIIDADGKTLGGEIEMQIVSWQDGWDVSPGADTEEAKKHVGYSDDGVHMKDTGMAVTEYLAELRRLGFAEAKTIQKCVIVGILLAAEKDSTLLGSTVQLSLSNQARKTFERYRFDRTIRAQMGKQPLDGAEYINVKAHLKKTSGNKDWTLLDVTGATPA